MTWTAEELEALLVSAEAERQRIERVIEQYEQLRTLDRLQGVKPLPKAGDDNKL